MVISDPLHVSGQFPGLQSTCCGPVLRNQRESRLELRVRRNQQEGRFLEEIPIGQGKMLLLSFYFLSVWIFATFHWHLSCQITRGTGTPDKQLDTTYWYPQDFCLRVQLFKMRIFSFCSFMYVKLSRVNSLKLCYPNPVRKSGWNLKQTFQYFQVPAFETGDGKYLTESNAIAYYGKFRQQNNLWYFLHNVKLDDNILPNHCAQTIFCQSCVEVFASTRTFKMNMGFHINLKLKFSNCTCIKKINNSPQTNN